MDDTLAQKICDLIKKFMVVPLVTERLNVINFDSPDVEKDIICQVKTKCAYTTYIIWYTLQHNKNIEVIEQTGWYIFNFAKHTIAVYYDGDICWLFQSSRGDYEPRFEKVNKNYIHHINTLYSFEISIYFGDTNDILDLIYKQTYYHLLKSIQIFKNSKISNDNCKNLIAKWLFNAEIHINSYIILKYKSVQHFQKIHQSPINVPTRTLD